MSSNTHANDQNAIATDNDGMKKTEHDSPMIEAMQLIVVLLLSKSSLNFSMNSLDLNAIMHLLMNTDMQLMYTIEAIAITHTL